MNELYNDQAILYDIAFDWDVSDEVDWLIKRLGMNSLSILEPGCGSGRMFPSFVKRGITITGIDSSKSMVENAKDRMRKEGLPAPIIHCMDMVDFDLKTTFDGAIMPINTFGYLTTQEKALGHLCSVAKNLSNGGKYLIQLDLQNLEHPKPISIDTTSCWEAQRNGTRIKMTWASKSFDPSTLIEIQFSRIEILAGRDKGKVFENLHQIRLWDWNSWSKLVSFSPFSQVAAYDGNNFDRPKLTLDSKLEHERLTWHELVKTGD